VVKRGSAGAIACYAPGLYRQPPFPVIPVDTTGAVDCFNGGYIYGYLKGKGVDDCMRLGNACGVFCVQRIGGASACAALVKPPPPEGGGFDKRLKAA